MADNLRHAQYGSDGIQIDDPADTYKNVSVNSLGTQLLGANGQTLLRVDRPTGADLMPATTEVQSSTAAISTTASVRFTPAGFIWRTVRLASTNNGASASAKYNIVFNCRNSVEGLVASQSSKQVDAVMTIGDALQILTPLVISSIDISSDTAITAGTHRIDVVFGA